MKQGKCKSNIQYKGDRLDTKKATFSEKYISLHNQFVSKVIFNVIQSIYIRKHAMVANSPSKVLLILVSGSRESLSSSTTSVRVSKAGSIRVNFIICPGNHDGGMGKSGKGMWVNTMDGGNNSRRRFWGDFNV
jgi:hypothetical protein